MTILLIILSVALWAGAFCAVPRRIILAPALSYLAMDVLSYARLSDGSLLFPLSNTMNMSWLAITLVVMVIIILQNPAIRQQGRGTAYMTMGALAGLAVGLLAYTFTPSLQLRYAVMVLATAAGSMLSGLVFTNTPDGRSIAPGSGHFLRYLLAKGFPILVAAGQLGVAAVMLLARYAA